MPRVLAPLLFLFCPLAARAQTDSDKIRDLIQTYTRSISLADTNLASQIWSRSPEVTFIHPTGNEHGFEEVKRDVYQNLMGGLFSERVLTARDVSVHVYGDTAWAEFNWSFVAKLRKDGSTARTEGRETQIYRKEGGGWRIVHIHYSGPPAAPPQ